MAPANKRPDIKSESWLDLSSSAKLAERDQLALKQLGSKQEASWRKENIPGVKRFARRQMSEDITSSRLASEDNYYYRAESRQRFSLAEDCMAASSKAQQHLLIRLRQQSYLNRSSNISTNSSLSNCSASIELEGQSRRSSTSLVSTRSEFCANYDRDRDSRAADARDSPKRHQLVADNLARVKRASSIYSDHVQVQQVAAAAGYSDLQVKREPGRLQAMRERLLGGRSRMRLDHRPSRHVRASTSSPFGRSWSSISDKFTNLRHSWKRFLYNYNQQQHSYRHDKNDEQLSPVVTMADLASLDRCELTSDWLSRHHGDNTGATSASLQGVLRAIDRANSSNNSGWPNEDEQAPGNKRSYQQSSSSSKQFKSTSGIYLTEESLAKSNSSSISQDNNSSSSITLVSESKNSVNPRVIVESPWILDDVASAPTRSTSPSDQRRPRSKDLEPTRQQQTSDYFSSATKSSGRPERAKMISNLAKFELSPLLLDDPEYYLDVAQAASQASSSNHRSHQSASSSKLASRVAELEDDFDDYAVPADESSRLDRSQVELVQMIGEGQKGFVFLGKLQSKDGRQIVDVALKTLKYETEELIEKLMREAAMMRQFEHPHIIKFIGVCPETPALIAMELAQLGEIKSYLGQNRRSIGVSQLVLFTFQISTALSYLEGKQFVHRDVAARNVLVCTHNCVKLADFGLSRNLQQASHNATTDYEQCWLEQAQSFDDSKSQYVAMAKGKLPVRWLAPESLVFRRFTPASDVWMFAVCAWEFFHYGQLRPWPSIRNNQVLLAIESGQRLSRPAGCPARLYQLMLQCWSYAPIQRPKFRDLKQDLWSIYLNERAHEHFLMEQQQQQQRYQLNHHPQHLQLEQNPARAQAASARLSAGARDWLPSPKIAGASQEVQLATKQMCLLSARADNKRYASSSPSAITPYVQGNLSGYSSAATAAADHSNDSSPSSSMGFSSGRASKTHGSPVARNSLAQAVAQRERAVEASRGRFSRDASLGHMLQKQRSQGNIVANRPSATEKVFLDRSQLIGFDDDALLLHNGYNRLRPTSLSACRQASKSPCSLVSLAKSHQQDYEDDGDEEDGCDSSESDPQRPIERLLLSSKLDQAGEQVNMVPLETHYDGVPVREIAILRPNKSSQNQTQAPIRSPASARATDPDREKKLASVLESLRVSPLRARLSCNPPPKVKLSPASQCDKKEEKLQQLALHERLLGHIRIGGVQSRERRSTHLHQGGSAGPQNSQSANGSSSSVDQSLQLLESLIIDEAQRAKSKTNSEISARAEKSSFSKTPHKDMAGKQTRREQPDLLANTRVSRRAFR